jgi:hypothetical protein
VSVTPYLPSRAPNQSGSDSDASFSKSSIHPACHRDPLLSAIKHHYDSTCCRSKHQLLLSRPQPQSCSGESNRSEGRQQLHHGSTRRGWRGPSCAAFSDSSSPQTSMNPDGGYFPLDRTSNRHCASTCCRSKPLLQFRLRCHRQFRSARFLPRRSSSPSSESSRTSSSSWLPSLMIGRCS